MAGSVDGVEGSATGVGASGLVDGVTVVAGSTSGVTGSATGVSEVSEVGVTTGSVVEEGVTGTSVEAGSAGTSGYARGFGITIVPPGNVVSVSISDSSVFVESPVHSLKDSIPSYIDSLSD